MSLSRFPDALELRRCFSKRGHRWGPVHFSPFYNRVIKRCRDCDHVEAMEQVIVPSGAGVTWDEGAP